MKTRTITGIILALILVPFLLFANEQVFAIGVMVPVVLASYEMLRMFKEKDDFGIGTKILCILIVLLSYLSVVGLWSNSNNDLFESTSIFNFFNFFYKYCNFTVVLMLISIIILGMTIFDKEFNSESAARLFSIVLYVALGFGSLMILRLIGKRLLVYLFIVTISTDVFAYFTGMLIGKHKMTAISPKKTWEGAIGGTLFATLIGSLFALNYDKVMNLITKIDWFKDEVIYDSILSTVCDLPSKGLEILTIIFITFLASIVGQIGDLVSSKMKRDNNIKDFSNLFPGHGGVLDRFDSSIYVSMFLVVILTALKCAFPIL